MEKIKYSPKHEKIVLGTLIKNVEERRKYTKIINPQEFHAEWHRVIYSGLQALVDNNLDYTPSTLATLLPQVEWGGIEYLDKLEKQGDLANLEHHIRKMRWDSSRMYALESLVPQLMNDLKDPQIKPVEVLQSAQNLVESLGNTGDAKFFEGGKDLSNRYSASLIARQMSPAFRTSGYKVMDKELSEGFAAGKLSVIAGSSSNGKTSLMLNMGYRQSKAFKIGFLPWEGGVQSAIDSLVSLGLKIRLETLIKFANILSTEEQKNIDDFTFNLFNSDRIAFLKEPPKSVMSGRPWDVNIQLLEWVESQLYEWKRDIIYWDLFTKKLAARDPDAISIALDRVQEMVGSNRLNQHICLLHQVTLKYVERQEDKHPTRDTLKGSGTWIENPDLVLAVHRPAVYEPGTKDNIIEVICLKQRRGAWPWKIIFDWDGACVKITKGRKGSYTYGAPDATTSYDNSI